MAETTRWQRLSLMFVVLVLQQCVCMGFQIASLSSGRISGVGVLTNERVPKTALHAQISEQEAKSAIDKVVAALRKDSQANSELGRLERVTVVLGYGSPTAGSHAVRFNASFKKGGFGLSAVPMPFGLGQTNESEGRGTMVGQVKASVDAGTGKVTSCSVFRDLGYGRSFTLKV